MRKEDEERILRFMADFEEQDMPEHELFSKTEKVPLHLTCRRLDQLAQLYESRSAKLCEIVECLAADLHSSDIATIDDITLKGIVEDASDAIDAWADWAISVKPRGLPAANLQELLTAHEELGEQILNIQDESIEREKKIRPENCA